ncbi:hypothetical protein M8C21_012516 [Ambrosia artemisiifolia]|uniref:Uncharacterized protein n=1 Tax=Ambrosia artemisiifolia TaxID=4212 RepID=A0AAD5G7X9_AMBAR|nr:hypothetical protein M8C21_012516 [Ambrosia artemisiifolia]
MPDFSTMPHSFETADKLMWQTSMIGIKKKKHHQYFIILLIFSSDHASFFCFMETLCLFLIPFFFPPSDLYRVDHPAHGLIPTIGFRHPATLSGGASTATSASKFDASICLESFESANDQKQQIVFTFLHLLKPGKKGTGVGVKSGPRFVLEGFGMNLNSWKVMNFVLPSDSVALLLCVQIVLNKFTIRSTAMYAP